MNGDGLWPKIPLKNAGIRMEPPISDPMPHADPALAYKMDILIAVVNTVRQKSAFNLLANSLRHHWSHPQCDLCHMDYLFGRELDSSFPTC